MEMAEEIDYDPAKPEVTELEIGVAENVSNNSVDEGKSVLECLEEESTDVEKQHQRLEEQGEKSPLVVIEFKEGGSRSGGAFVIGANHKFPVRSRYLSGGSISSCHDLCKFGHKHGGPDKNTMRPLLGTIRETRPLARTGSDNMVKVLNEGSNKKKDGRRLSLPGSNKVDKDSPIVKNYCERELTFKRVQSEIKPSSVISPRLRNRNESQIGKKIVCQSSSLVKEVKPEPRKIVARSSSSVKEVKPEPRKIVARSLSLVGNTTPKVKVVKPEPEKETVSGEKGKVEVKEKAKEPMNGSITPQTPMKKSSSIKATIYKNLKNVSRSKKPIVSNEASKVEPLKKVSKVASLNAASASTTRRSQVSKNKDSKDDQTSSQNGPSSSSKPINSKVVHKIKSENGCSEDRRTAPKRRGVLPEEKDLPSSWKVKFKRGTVIALQGSNNSPRKLKFKRGKILNNDENGKNGIVRELKPNNDTGNEPNRAKVEAVKVQLRHQEASGKKDSVDLNNVIEETATKLVKTRKSKVKALVGAFESVMSIRDSPMEAGAS